MWYNETISLWMTKLYIYIYILSSTDRSVSFYQNSSVWLDRLDSRSWDQNLVDIYIYIYIYIHKSILFIDFSLSCWRSREKFNCWIHCNIIYFWLYVKITFRFKKPFEFYSIYNSREAHYKLLTEKDHNKMLPFYMCDLSKPMIAY